MRGEETTHPVAVALDVRFDAVTPAIGTDGQPSGGPSRPRPPPRRHGGQGASRTGRALDGLGSPSTASRHEWRGAHGNRDRSWGPRRWGGPKMWRWFPSTSARKHFGGIRFGTEAGDLHRGWVSTAPGPPGGRMALANRAGRRRGDAQVVHLDVVDKAGRTTTCAATSCGWPTSAGPPAPWSTRAGPLDLRRRPARRAPATASASTCTSSMRREAGRPVVAAPVSDPTRATSWPRPRPPPGRHVHDLHRLSWCPG